jgi:hypothetical protein
MTEIFSRINSLLPKRALTVGRVRTTLLLCFVWLLSSSAHPLSADEVPSEYQVKAAFLYNFTKFVEWPDSAFAGSDSPFVIGIVGRDPFGSILDRTVEGKTVVGRNFVVRRYRTAADMQPCHLLFISESENGRLAKVLQRVGRHTLTVGDVDKFLQRGGAVNFVIESNKVRFEINLDAADRAGLRISSKLLALARVVKSKSS